MPGSRLNAHQIRILVGSTFQRPAPCRDIIPSDVPYANSRNKHRLMGVTVEKLSVRFIALFQINTRALRGRLVGLNRWGRFSIRSALRGRRCDPEFAGVSRVGESPNATTRPIGWVRVNSPQFSLVVILPSHTNLGFIACRSVNGPDLLPSLIGMARMMRAK